jgi:hypothetical protein
MRQVVGGSILVVLLVAGAGVDGRGTQRPTVDEQLTFLKTARVVSTREIGKGVTGALRVTLSDGALTHDAAFQSVDQRARPSDIAAGRRKAGELLFVDAYRYNIAAWELARLVGLDHMMPATIERRIRGINGALSWWVDDVLMDEAERDAKGAQPPEGMGLALARQRQKMYVFAELVRDTDRNKGNVIYTTDWRLIMIDFTRAFRLEPTLRQPDNLIACERNLLARLRTLTKEEVQQATDPHLTIWEVEALMKRRDLIVERFDKLIAERGEAVVLF